MSISKRLIDEIQSKATELHVKNPNLHWYECLNQSTQEITVGKYYFADLSPYFQQQLLKSQNDLEVCCKKIAKEIKKKLNISYTEARKLAANSLGIDDHEKITEISRQNSLVDQELNQLLQVQSGRTLVTKLSEYIKLPKLDGFYAENGLNKIFFIHQFDYIKVPIKACDKYNISPIVFEGDMAILPIIVLRYNGKLKDFQYPIDRTPEALSMINKSLMEEDVTFRLSIISGDTEIISPICDECGLDSDECICSF